MTDPPRSAAWAPWRRDREWLLRRDVLACSWLASEAKNHGDHVVVQGESHAHHYREGDSPIARLARRGDVSTYRSPVRDGATLVPDANIRLLATGLVAANGRSVVATESPTLPLVGWAMASGAINLDTGEVTPDTRSTSQINAVQDFVDSLYNGWAHKEVGRRASAYYLPKLAESGMRYEVFVGSVLALDPAHLDNNRDIDEMYRALPPVWSAQRDDLRNAWRNHLG